MKTNNVSWAPPSRIGEQTMTVKGLVMIEVEDVTRFTPHDDMMGTHVLDQKGARIVLAALQKGEKAVQVTSVMTTSRSSSAPDGVTKFAQEIAFPLPSDELERQALMHVLILAST